MKITLHGGDCCGVKHIRGLGVYPDMYLTARVAVSKGSERTSIGHGITGATNDMRHKQPDTQHEDFFNEEAPKESYNRRLGRMIRFIKHHRSHGLIEIILNPNQTAWHDKLRRRKFKLVTTFKNSNTGSTLTVWHLAY
jgi:hypothetical protein